MFSLRLLIERTIDMRLQRTALPSFRVAGCISALLPCIPAVLLLYAKHRGQRESISILGVNGSMRRDLLHSDIRLPLCLANHGSRR